MTDERIALTETDLIEALLGARERAAQGGMTSAEIAAACGMSLAAVRRRLQMLKNQGRLKCVGVARERLDGALTTLSGYRLRGVRNEAATEVL